MLHFQFVCPKCGRKKLLERFQKATVNRSILRAGFYYPLDPVTSTHRPITWYRAGDETIEDYDKATYKFQCKRCSFELPIRNIAELIEWLLFHKMGTLPGQEAIKWPHLRDAYIKSGEISRALLEELYGKTYVPPVLPPYTGG